MTKIKLTLLLAFLFMFNLVFSQSREADLTIVTEKQWSDPKVFRQSQIPLITGYGTYSDSLKQVYGFDFYHIGKEYFQIDSWADYYYWFTQKYWFLFYQPELYEAYYITGNDVGMVSYIIGHNYQADYYPSPILVAFTDGTISTQNRLADATLIPFGNKEIGVLRSQIEYERIKARKENQNSGSETSRSYHHNSSISPSTLGSNTSSGGNTANRNKTVMIHQ